MHVKRERPQVDDRAVTNTSLILLFSQRSFVIMSPTDVSIDSSLSCSEIVDDEAMYSRTIQNAMRLEWGMESNLHVWQKNGIRILIDQSKEDPPPTLLLVRRTGDGKSTVIRGTATILGGISLIVMPTLSLAYDQIASIPRDRINAIHLDYVNKGGKEAIRSMYNGLREQMNLDPSKTRTTFIFASPKALVNSELVGLPKGTCWADLFVDLRSKGVLRFLAVDEVHMGLLHGLIFRPEYPALKDKLFKPLADCGGVPTLFCSATVTPDLVNDFESMWGVHCSHKIWATPDEMSKRNVKIRLVSRANFKRTFKDDILRALEKKDRKVIVYTNKKANVESIRDSLVDDSKEDDLIGLTITGDTPSEEKSANILLFTNKWENEEICGLCRLLVASAECANVGIDAKVLELIYREGIPPSLIDLLQELGRLGRGDDQKDFVYHILANVEYFAFLLFRAYTLKDTSATEYSLRLIYESLALVVGINCWHAVVEKKFGKPGVLSTLPPTCGDMCPACSGDRDNCMGLQVSRQELSKLLLDKLASSTVSMHPGFTSLLLPKDEGVRKKLYGKKTVNAYDVDFLALQLLSAGLVKDIKKVEKDLKNGKDTVVVHIGLRFDGNTTTLACNSCWELINTK